MLGRHRRQDGGDYSDFLSGASPSSIVDADARWRQLLRDVGITEEADRPALLHRSLSSVPYLPDLLNYGLADAWATPREFLANGGDCEDYAIACFHALLLAMPERGPRVVVLQPKRPLPPHAVCVFQASEDLGVLDWLTGPRPWDDADRYIYSIDHERWWRPVD